MSCQFFLLLVVLYFFYYSTQLHKLQTIASKGLLYLLHFLNKKPMMVQQSVLWHKPWKFGYRSKPAKSSSYIYQCSRVVVRISTRGGRREDKSNVVYKHSSSKVIVGVQDQSMEWVNCRGSFQTNKSNRINRIVHSTFNNVAMDEVCR